MAWNWLKLPRLPISRMLQWRPSAKTLKQGSIAAVLCALIGGAFYLGRQGALSHAGSSTAVVDALTEKSPLFKNSGSYSGPPVAYIYGSTPVTRQELGEYLIERFGPERVEFLVNRKIIEMVCKERGIVVTDAEVNADFKAQCEMLQCNEAEFVKKILVPRNTSLYEWREDSIRPRLAMQRYFQDKVQIGEEQLQKAFEAKYGPKVECRMIVIGESQIAQKYDIWNRVKDDAAEFEREAKKSFIAPLAAAGGLLPRPIHKHIEDPVLEAEAFKLKAGEVSGIVEMPATGPNTTKTLVILRCEKRIDADTTKTLGQVRNELYHEVFEVTVDQLVKASFARLRDEAKPQILLQRERPPQVQQPAVTSIRPPTPPSGN